MKYFIRTVSDPMNLVPVIMGQTDISLLRGEGESDDYPRQ